MQHSSENGPSTQVSNHDGDSTNLVPAAQNFNRFKFVCIGSLGPVVIMPWCACASEVYSSVCVCVCVRVCRLLQLLRINEVQVTASIGV